MHRYYEELKKIRMKDLAETVKLRAQIKRLKARIAKEKAKIAPDAAGP